MKNSSRRSKNKCARFTNTSDEKEKSSCADLKFGTYMSQP